MLLTYILPYLYAAPTYADLVVDGVTGHILHATNEHTQVHPASLTKKMTLYLIFEDLKSGKIKLNTMFRVSSKATQQIPSKLGLRVGEVITVENAIKALVTKSANDVAYVVAEGLEGSLSKFVIRMNKKAKQLGMKKTIFFNASGVPDKRQWTTAYDMMLLARSLYRDFPSRMHYFKTQFFHYKGSVHRNHNRMLGQYVGLDGIKTGYVQASGFNISTSAVKTIAGKPHRLFAVVMGGQSWRSRDVRASKLLDYGFYSICKNVKAPRLG
jgi:D-alanyl-D-alanine carboxypeptidase